MSSIVEYSHSVQQSSCNKIAVISNDVANKKIGKMLTLGIRVVINNPILLLCSRRNFVAQLLGASIKRVQGIFMKEYNQSGHIASPNTHKLTHTSA